MSKHIVEELPARKHAPAAAAAAAKKGEKGKGATEESSEKRIRQAVYDIRYRARREEMDLRQAFSQYMSHSSLNPAERTAVKAKLFGKGGGVSEQYAFESVDWAVDTVANAMFKVFVEGVQKEEVIELPYEQQLAEEQERKYKVRVTDVKNNRSYVRYATREKITQLRARGLKVEMTEHGEPYEGERRRGETTARALGGGAKKAKRDYDGDGKVESSSKEHAGAVHNAIQRKTGGKPDGQDTRKTVSASYEPEGEVLDEMMRRPKFRYDNNNKNKAQSSRSHPGRGGGSQNPQARFNASNPSTTSSDSPNGDSVKEEHKPGHKKGDGNLANNYPPYDKVTRGDVIAGALGKDQKGGKDVKEDFLADAVGDSANPNSNVNKIDVMKGKNVVKVFPDDSSNPEASKRIIQAGTELEGELIAEKAMSKAQQKFMGMVYARKKGKMKKGEASPEVEAAAKSMTKKEAKKFAKTKHKGLPEKVSEGVGGYDDPVLGPHTPLGQAVRTGVKVVKGAVTGAVQGAQGSLNTAKTKPSKPQPQAQVKEAADCGCDDKGSDKEKERDTRGDYAKTNLIKNKLRAMGAKNPIVMIASEETVEEGMGLSVGGAKLIGKLASNPRTPEAQATKAAQKNITDPIGFAVKGAARAVLGVGDEKNQQMMQKRQPQTPLQRQVAARTQQVVNQSYEPEGEVIDEAKYGTAKGRKALAKKVRAGKDVGKKGAGFEEIVDKASPKVGKKRATKIAAAAMWKNLANSYEPEGEVIDESERREIDQERFGVGGRPGERRPERPAPAPGTQRRSKRRSSAPSAMDIVRQATIAKYGKGALM